MQIWNLPENLNTFQKPKKDLMNLFLSGVSRRAAIIMLYLFGPIYIYQSFRVFGYSYKFALVITLLFFVLTNISKIIFTAISENLSQKIGFKGTIKLSAVPFFLFILSIIFASSYPHLFILSAIFLGSHTALYWWGYHGYFIKTGDKDHFGLSISEAGFLETIVSVATPFLGAVITTFLGFNTLYIVSALFIFLSLFLLGKDHDRRQRRDIKFTHVLDIIKTHKSISLAYGGSGGEAVLYIVVWPLFLFLFFGQLISLGIIASLASLVAAIFSLAIGDWVDKQGEKAIVKFGSPLVFISWLIRTIDKSFAAFVFADSFWNFGQRMVVLPLNALSYKKALEGKSSARAILFREMTITLGAIFSLTIVSVLIYSFDTLSVVFVVAMIFSLMPLIAVFKGRLKDSK